MELDTNRYGKIGMPVWSDKCLGEYCHMRPAHIVANGKEVETAFPITIEQFLVSQKLLPRSVVVEHNGEAVTPSEFSRRKLNSGDRLEIVRIVAGG